MLDIQSVSAKYGKVQALKDITLRVPAEKVVTILGANGAGKTTTMRTISGLLSPAKGQIIFDGQRIDRFSPSRIVRLGISMVPEGRLLFPQMTVLENMEMGAFTRKGVKGLKQDYERVFAYFPALKDRKNQLSATLSGGEAQMLAIGRAIMAKPKLMLLDEPSLGLAPLLVDKIFEIIKRINTDEGCTILLVEQNATLALTMSHIGYIMEVGEVILSDESRKLAENEMVKRAYLGG